MFVRAEGLFGVSGIPKRMRTLAKMFFLWIGSHLRKGVGSLKAGQSCVEPKKSKAMDVA